MSAFPSSPESESERHAIAHAKYICAHASPSDPEVCFDYELIQTLLSLIDRLRGLAQTGQQWQLIETAPPMKTILLFAVTDVAADGAVLNWKMATGAYLSSYEGSVEHSPWEWGGRQLAIYELHPTHWMDLPAAPSDTSTDRCADCGHPRAEHSYNGACYGLCGKFVSPDSSPERCQVCGEPADLTCGPSRFGDKTWACKDCWDPDTRPDRKADL